MTSKEAVLELIELCKKYHHKFVNKDVELLTIRDYPLDRIVKDLDKLEKIKQLYETWQAISITDVDFIKGIREVFRSEK